MPKLLTVTILAILFAGPAWSQEEPPATTTDAAEPATEVAEVAEVPEEPKVADDAAETDDSDLDVQTYEEDEDDFVPTEEIPTDEPIPFPSNI
jgi:hypothetical protein